MVKYFSLIILLLTICTSCIKDDLSDCPDPTFLNIIVEDKNYDNAAEIEDYTPVNENLPMINYVNPLSIWMHKVNSDEAKELAMNNDQTTYPISSDSFSDGNYKLSVAGNYLLQVPENNSETAFISLHPDGTEGSDIYLGNDVFDIPLNADRIINLNRTKGRLLLKFVDFPENITRVNLTASNVYSTINSSKEYSGSTNVKKTFVPGQPDMFNYYSIMLAPTPAETTTGITIEMLGENGDLIYTLTNINLAIQRNHLSVLQARYIPEEERWEVSLFFDGEWKVIHNLSIV